ncbi:MAG: polysaccharide biosynthesis C-terminal domain-containing protein [Lachnospiraceae bacterium]
MCISRGLPFLVFYNIATGIFSALGSSQTPFIFLAVFSTANILVDILFVAGFHMGVAGVAWATFLCQGISAVLAIAVVLKRLAKIRTEKKVALFSWKILGRIVRIAVPSILQQSFISFGNIIIETVINGYGPSVIAGYAAAVKLNNLVITFVYNDWKRDFKLYSAEPGAGKQERIRQGFFAGLKMIWTICVPMIVLYFLAGRWLLYLFMDQPTDTAMHTGILFLRILSPFYLIVSAKLVADGDPARHRTDETVYDDDVYRSAAACDARGFAVACVRRDRDLVRMACGLVDRDDFVAAVLPQGRVWERENV